MQDQRPKTRGAEPLKSGRPLATLVWVHIASWFVVVTGIICGVNGVGPSNWLGPIAAIALLGMYVEMLIVVASDPELEMTGCLLLFFAPLALPLCLASAVYRYYHAHPEQLPWRSRTAQVSLRAKRIAQLEASLGIAVLDINGTCEHCGKVLQSGAEFCVYCGKATRPRPRICPKCATVTMPDARYCPKCRAPLEPESENS